MARESEDHPGDPEEQDEGGGPVKSFLEHLEDLRWTLIKSIVAVLVGVLICMVGGKYLVAILVWPLQHAGFGTKGTNEVVVAHMGKTHVTNWPIAQVEFLRQGTNVVQSVSIVPILNGTNVTWTLQTDAEPFISPDGTPPALNLYGPVSSIMVAMKLALWGGLLVSAPFLFYFLGQFVLPALHYHEKKLLYQAVGIGTGLFFLGVIFCYFIITGVALAATVQFAQWLGFGASEWRGDEYVSFVTKFMLGMGLSFELPVVILVLVKIGMLDYQALARFRTYMVVVNLVAAAIITPSGDPFSMLLFAAPLQLLYEVSVFIAWLWDRKERKLREAEEAE